MRWVICCNRAVARSEFVLGHLAACSRGVDVEEQPQLTVEVVERGKRLAAEFRSCVKVEVDVLGSPS